MATSSQAILSPLLRPAGSVLRSFVCAQCRRTFSSGPALLSGHNRWSKIKHEKGAADKKKNALRNQVTHNLAVYSRLYGANPALNPQLASEIAAAKKANVPKAVIDGAIARGQGRSVSGASLEPLTLSLLAPTTPAAALIVDVETDNRARALQDLRLAIKKHKATVGSAEFFFRRAGRVVFAPGREAGAAAAVEEGGGASAEGQAEVGVEDVMDAAIEAGAEDLEEDDEGNIVVWTGPSATSQVVAALGEGSGPAGAPNNAFGLKVLSSDIVWAAIEETRVQLDSAEDAVRMAELAAALQEYPDVQGVYSNAARGEGLTDEEWQRVEENLDS